MIIVGLGNPGVDYQETRHNVGYMFVDKVAESNNVKFKLDKAFEAWIGEFYLNNEKHLLVKPITFMNNSGRAVEKILHYYEKEIADLIVIYDDMDLDVGIIRIRKMGGSGGHNGMKSIIESVNSQEFKRIRVGIGRSETEAIDYVLGKFSKKDRELIQKVLDSAPLMINELLTKGIDYLMNHYNSSENNIS